MTRRKRFVVMVGTALEGRGGMSSVVANYRQQGFFERAGIRYLEAHRELSGFGKARLMVTSLLRLWLWLLSGQVALLHVHTASGISFWRKSLFALSGRLFSIPVIMHIHGGEFMAFYGHSPAPARWLIRFVLEGASRVAVLSVSWQHRLEGISKRLRFVVLPNPVPLSGQLVPAPTEGRALRFLFLGRLERDKGVFDLVDAFALLCRDYANCTLILAGDGDREGVQNRLASLGLEAKVSLPGWVSGTDKEALLQAADVFLLPSYIEGLPVSMLEAMACAIPVIVSRVGSIPEVLEDGRNGLLIEAGNVPELAAAMGRLAQSSEERLRLGSAGHDLIAQEFAADRVCRRLAEVYTSATDGEIQ